MLLNLPIIIGAALADSVNPAVFSILIFLLTSLTKHTDSKRTLSQGTTFIVGFFTTSLFSGIVLLPSLHVLSNISQLVYPLLGLAIGAIGIIELFKHARPKSQLSLKSIFNHNNRAKHYSHKISSALTSTFALGFIVSLAELPFSGGIYLATLSLINLTSPSLKTLPTLIVYNLVLVIPLVIILLTTQRGLSTEKFKFWQKSRHSQLHLGIGTLLIILGAWLLTYQA